MFYADKPATIKIRHVLAAKTIASIVLEKSTADMKGRLVILKCPKLHKTFEETNLKHLINISLFDRKQSFSKSTFYEYTYIMSSCMGA